MSSRKRKIGRRTFVGELSKGILAAGGALAAGQAVQGQTAEPAKSDNPAARDDSAATMPLVALGKTGLRVSKISLGTCPPPSLPVFSYCLQQGINYFDAAESYANGKAETTLGDYFQQLGLDRKKFCLSTKTYDREPSHWEAKVSTACKRMRIDYVDLFYAHDMGIHQPQPTDIDPTWISRPDVIAGAKALKKSGLIRHFGFSVHHRRPEHTWGLLREAAKGDVVEFIMLQYNFRDEKNERLREALAVARKADIAIISCKPQGMNQPLPERLKGYLAPNFNRWQAAIRWLANDSLVDVICSNMLNLEQAQQNIAAVKAPALRTAELRELRRYAEATAGLCCHQCGECLEACPLRLDVPTILRAKIYHDNYGLPEQARETYASIAPPWRADRCGDCGACERVCPHGIAVRRQLARATELFGGRA